MDRSILIVAPAKDAHAIALATVLRSEFGVEAVVWDSASFPAQASLSLTLNAGTDFDIDGPHVRLSLDRLRSVWWRRPNPYHVNHSVTDPKVRSFCAYECDALFKGALDVIDVPIINHPFHEQRAAYKPFQLWAARRAGLAIPRTLMSNDPAAIRTFWESVHGRCIYKPFTAPFWTMSETRPLAAEDLDDLDTLRHAPIIVQQKIERGLDVRVNIFGDAVFAAAVETHVAEAALDWRMDLTATWREHHLPDNVAASLERLLADLGLQYGCIDMRQQPDGEYTFFEVNPSGQFLFVEIDTGQPLVRALAELLMQAGSLVSLQSPSVHALQFARHP